MVLMLETKNIIINNKTGLHTRSVAQFVKKASEFESKITIIFDDNEINAKSIMGVLSLGIRKGDEITVKVKGKEAKSAVLLFDFIEVE